jgi:organic radical activating enzyme
MPNPTCRLLSNGYKFNINWDSSITYRPCCHFTQSQNLDSTESQHQEFRKYLNEIDSYKSNKTCHDCNFQENAKLRKTFRDRSFDWVPDDAELGDASYLELQIDNTCNGGCIMCGSWYSSYWQSELGQFDTKPAIDPLDRILSFVDIQKTRRILFLGGEPFLSKVDQKILPLIDHPELVDLQYTTNGSIYPSQHHINQWSRFKSVFINVSLDGIGSRFEYIRYPLKWDVVEKNLLRMFNEMPSNVQFQSNHTVNILNLYYHDEFKNWFDKNWISHAIPRRMIDFSFTPCSGVLQPFNVPKKLFDLLIAKYGYDSKIYRIVGDDRQEDHASLLDHLSVIDQRRKLNWRQVFPEISDCF